MTAKSIVVHQFVDQLFIRCEAAPSVLLSSPADLPAFCEGYRQPTSNCAGFCCRMF
jgi:hypothetical protein